ncbi:MAG: hypothetical protein DM484_17070 [Candidatus Methylumidiphilus alinenensis]|jgi:hypothetical protein|uniref:Uncharacterized protein n=1 Tax=Candidatus Methylumidiphilus alinenensis TaxID=2202197 RepID=A0A2W4SLJ8_9GAMM|nr:MAG: hypothetical protein DM484_17070 [Candidatus Methylumidiphilus alinenensis]
MAKTASLNPTLVTKKGAATPAVTTPDMQQPATSYSEKRPEKEYYKALTVKLDKERYFKLKQTGLHLEASSQEIIVKALDEYLGKM